MELCEWCYWVIVVYCICKYKLFETVSEVENKAVLRVSWNKTIILPNNNSVDGLIGMFYLLKTSTNYNSDQFIQSSVHEL